MSTLTRRASNEGWLCESVVYTLVCYYTLPPVNDALQRGHSMAHATQLQTEHSITSHIRARHLLHALLSYMPGLTLPYSSNTARPHQIP